MTLTIPDRLYYALLAVISMATLGVSFSIATAKLSVDRETKAIFPGHEQRIENMQREIDGLIAKNHSLAHQLSRIDPDNQELQ